MIPVPLVTSVQVVPLVDCCHTILPVKSVKLKLAEPPGHMELFAALAVPALLAGFTLMTPDFVITSQPPVNVIV